MKEEWKDTTRVKWSRQEEIEYRNPSRIDSSERNSRVNGWGIWERQGAVGQGIPKGEKVRRSKQEIRHLKRR